MASEAKYISIGLAHSDKLSPIQEETQLHQQGLGSMLVQSIP